MGPEMTLEEARSLFLGLPGDPVFELELILLTVGDVVSTRMNELSMTKADLARKLDVSPPRVSQILRGDENLTLRTLARLGCALGLRFELATDDSTNRIARVTPIWSEAAPPTSNEIHLHDEGTLAEAA